MQARHCIVAYNIGSYTVLFFKSRPKKAFSLLKSYATTSIPVV